MSVDYMNLNGKSCPCGKEHSLSIEKVLIGKGKVNEICSVIRTYKAQKPFVMSDMNTEKAAGSHVKAFQSIFSRRKSLSRTKNQ